MMLYSYYALVTLLVGVDWMASIMVHGEATENPLGVWEGHSFEHWLYARYGGANSSSIRIDDVLSLMEAVRQGTGGTDPRGIYTADCSDTNNMSCPCLLKSSIQKYAAVNLTLNASTEVSGESFEGLCPNLLGWLASSQCDSGDVSNEHQQKHGGDRPTTAQVWGYGFLFVTIINGCSLVGAAVIPIMKKAYYTYIMTYLVALAAGSLASSGLLVLIPEAFEIVEHEGYVLKAMAILGGSYLFFILERILSICNSARSVEHTHLDQRIPSEESETDKKYTELDEMNEKSPDDPEDVDVIDPRIPCSGYCSSTAMFNEGEQSAKEGQSQSNNGKLKKPDVQSIAWMIVVGDALHNFIDGLSIGAAFTESMVLGISISIAVICEELPHELGDFAILLNAGMSVKKALLFNFLSATTCYLGLIIGISLGSLPGVTPWILSLAGGMFLYIALADMLPEMNAASVQMSDSPLTVFLIQNGGLLTGFAVISLVTVYGGDIPL